MSLVPGRASSYVGVRDYSRYYSGSDVKVYFGGYWIDEIVHIQYSVNENVAPIFGYASYTWDKVARGNRYVTGSFAINFKEVGYLQTILDSLSSNQKKGKWLDLGRYESRNVSNKKTGHVGYEKNVEKLVSNFDSLAEDYEKALWGEKSNSSSLLSSRSKNTLYYNTSNNKNNQTLRDNGFNMLIRFGDTEDVAIGSEYSDTVQTIVGVQITGSHTQVDPSGTPVQEVYEFIAKDISANATKSH